MHEYQKMSQFRNEKLKALSSLVSFETTDISTVNEDLKRSFEQIRALILEFKQA